MRTLLHWLLGSDELRATRGETLSLRFATPPAPWIMLTGAVLAAALIWLLYRREAMVGRWRWLAGGLRLGVVMTVLFVIGQPLLVVKRTLVDPSRVVLLVDQSASMALRDGRESSGNRETRWEEALRSLESSSGGLIALLPSEQRVSVWAFADEALEVASMNETEQRGEVGARLRDLQPTGPASDVLGSIDRVLDATQGERVAGLVVAGDGRQTVAAGHSRALQRARARSIPIHILAAGSGRALKDVRIESAWCESEVFVRDAVLIRVGLRASGCDESTTLELQLRDQGSGELLASKNCRVEGRDSLNEVELLHRPLRAGRRQLRVIAEAGAEDENPDNNWADVLIHAREEKIGVLYVENSPRFEYRYLKNLLQREPTIENSCLLLGASPGFTQEGSRPIRQFPQSVEELDRYDVIILGDVDPRGEWASPTQLSLLADHVMVNGAGLALLSGERNMPHRLRNTPLERLLPVRLDGAGPAEESSTRAYTVALTPEGRGSGLLRFDADDAGPTGGLPEWYWFARVIGAAPAASVLAVNPAADDAPVLVLGRAGAGRTLFVGSDDVWRWRRGGEHYYDAFWMQSIRLLARGRKLGQNSAWRLETDRRRYELGERVRVMLRATDPMAAASGETPRVQVSDIYRGLVERLTLSPNAETHALEAIFMPPRAGAFVLTASPSDGARSERPATCDISVVAAEAERLRPEADHEFLRNLAAQTGGVFIRAGDDPTPILRAIPDRNVRHVDDLEEPIWDKPIILIIFSLLIVSEWIVRKYHGLP